MINLCFIGNFISEIRTQRSELKNQLNPNMYNKNKSKIRSNMILAYRLGMNWTQINTYMIYQKYHYDDCCGWW